MAHGVKNREQIAWEDRFNIGVEAVDKAHSRLFQILGKLQKLSADPLTYGSTYKEGIKYLEAYTMSHFSEEEAYMRSIRYEGYVRHKRIHDNFRDETLVSLKRDLEQSGYSQAAVLRFIKTMEQWLVNHIMKEDQAIVGRAASRGGRDSSAQVPVISKAINRAAMDVFQAEARLENEEYKGQNFGEGIYCYQSYEMEGGARLQMLFGIEETLMRRGAGRLPASPVSLKEAVSRQEVLRAFEPLFGAVGKLFRIEAGHRLTQDNLLSRDEFRREFMKGYPCRLLFGTRKGHIVFCCRSLKGKEQKAKIQEN